MSELTVQEQVIVRAREDELFRRRLLADPRAVLAEEYNVHIPENVEVRVLEDTSGTISLVLPAAEDALEELSDEELETVAGGSWSIKILWTLVCAGSGDPDD